MQAVMVSDIMAAAARLAPFISPTPLLGTPDLDARLGGRAFVKAECVQLTGSFKIRGALNRLLQLDASQKQAGVVAFSSGNHAQGVALAARLVGVPARIVMPADAPAPKRARTAALGAEVILYDRQTEDREAIARGLADRLGAVLVPPFDDPAIIAGQGTVGLEIAAALRARGLVPDQVLVCCSGGGLSSGVGIAIRDAFPDVALITVEPDGYDDTARSLVAGERQRLTHTPPSICDALLLTAPGVITFPILKGLGARGVSVSDDAARQAMAVAADQFRLMVEPGGAVALAALLTGKVATRGLVSVAVLSGGNVDARLFGEVIGAA